MGLDPHAAETAKFTFGLADDRQKLFLAARPNAEERLAVLHRLAILTNISTTSPATSDSISFINFIASIMQSTCPASTFAPTVTKASALGLGEA